MKVLYNKAQLLAFDGRYKEALEEMDKVVGVDRSQGGKAEFLARKKEWEERVKEMDMKKEEKKE